MLFFLHFFSLFFFFPFFYFFLSGAQNVFFLGLNFVTISLSFFVKKQRLGPSRLVPPWALCSFFSSFFLPAHSTKIKLSGLGRHKVQNVKKFNEFNKCHRFNKFNLFFERKKREKRRKQKFNVSLSLSFSFFFFFLGDPLNFYNFVPAHPARIKLSGLGRHTIFSSISLISLISFFLKKKKQENKRKKQNKKQRKRKEKKT